MILFWIKLQIESPLHLYDCTSIKSQSEQFIILLVGKTVNLSMLNDILIYDTEKQSFCKSSTKKPFTGFCRAINVYDRSRDEKLAHGFIHNIYPQGLSFNVLQFISSFYSQETIYLYRWNTGCHWKINIDHILHNIET